ncbi:MAG TPA: DUF4743 domain-containing protein [Magnetospirillum sp.]|jgi:hypothetical protein|nr:DUF4743 domain-containing protein [Magnetospirillum sp.]
MAFLDHVRACNFHDIAKFRPFVIADTPVGWVRHDWAAKLAAHRDTLLVDSQAVRLHPRLETPEQRSEALDWVCERLRAEHGTPALRGERYAVARRWGEAPLMTIDRGVVSLFGVRAYGVHVNGVVRDGAGMRLWIAKRAVDRAVAPGQLDNMIAGGQPADLGLMENLVKEAAEEADIPEAVARTACPVGVISYCQEDAWGLKPDTMFCYDLDVPVGFEPRNTDGEIESFRQMELGEVAERVRDTQDFKFNVNLVLIDFLVRHGRLCPDSEPAYVELVRGLRRDCGGC